MEIFCAYVDLIPTTDELRPGSIAILGQNRYVRDVMTQEMQSTLLTTVNAPYQTCLDGRALAAALSAGDVKLGQVNSFFMETSSEDQQAFAKLHGVPESVLIEAAESFANWSGQELTLLA